MSDAQGGPLVSVIIPALNEAENIVACLTAARREYRHEQVELIVADGGSADGTPELAAPYARVVPCPRGRAVQMNRGAAASHGEVLVFCHADSRLPAGWRADVLAHLAMPGVVGGTFLTLLLPERGWLLRWRNRIRFAADWRFMFGDQVQFLRRATFAAIGGFPKIPLMEDVEFSRAMARRGKLVRIPNRVVTSSRRFLERGAIRQTLGNGWRILRYLYLGATPEEIAAGYRSSRERTP